MKLNRFGLCKRYYDYNNKVVGVSIEKHNQTTIFLFIPSLLFAIIWGLIFSNIFHFHLGNVIGFSIVIFVLGLVISILSAVIASQLGREDESHKYMFPAFFTNWLPLIIIDLITLPFVCILSLFQRDINDLLKGKVNKKKANEPYILRNISSNGKISNELTNMVISEFIEDQIGRKLQDIQSDNGNKIIKESCVVTNHHQSDEDIKTILIAIKITRITRFGTCDSAINAYYFLTLTLDDDTSPEFVKISNPYFFGNNRSKVDVDRAFDSYIKTSSNNLGLGYNPFNEYVLQEIHDLGHCTSTPESESKAAVTQ